MVHNINGVPNSSVALHPICVKKIIVVLLLKTNAVLTMLFWMQAFRTVTDLLLHLGIV